MDFCGHKPLQNAFLSLSVALPLFLLLLSSSLCDYSFLPLDHSSPSSEYGSFSALFFYDPFFLHDSVLSRSSYMAALSYSLTICGSVSFCLYSPPLSTAPHLFAHFYDSSSSLCVSSFYLFYLYGSSLYSAWLLQLMRVHFCV